MKTFILADGSGTRFFSLSRTCYPKQFIPLVETESPFFEIGNLLNLLRSKSGIQAK